MTLNNFSVRIFAQSESPNDNTEPTRIPSETNQYVYLRHGEHYFIRIKNNFKVDAMAEISIDGDTVGKYLIPAKDKLDIEHPLNDTGKFTFYKSDSDESTAAGLDNADKRDLGLVSVTFIPFKEEVKKEDTVKIYKEYITVPYYHHYWYCNCSECRPSWNYPVWRYEPGYILHTTETFDTLLSYQEPNDSIPNNDFNIGSSAGNLKYGTVAINALENGHASINYCNSNVGGTGLSGESDKEYFAPPEDTPLDVSNKTDIHLRLLLETNGLDKPRPRPRPKSGYITPIPD